MQRAILQYLDTAALEMTDCLRRLVLIQSGTSNKAGVDLVGQAIADLLKPIMAEEVIGHENIGNTLVFRTPAAKRSPPVMLIGHMDTVFPATTEFNWYREDDRHAYGPGVADMKGGLVVGIFALKALAATGVLESFPIVFVCNSDEEIGSPVSRDTIAREAKVCQAALVLECGSMSNGVVTGRKGRVGISIAAKGVAGHAAFANKSKCSAILELSHKIIELEALNGLSPGISVNVGRISGGIGPNTVPENANAEVDVRYTSAAELEIFKQEFRRIIERNHVRGVETQYTTRSDRAPMPCSEENRKIFSLVACQAKTLGFEVVEEFRSGCSDANIIASLGVPVIDGLGPLGDLDHSDREYILKESLLGRAKLLALSMHELLRTGS
jgi:glutamate carboxypeptidase